MRVKIDFPDQKPIAIIEIPVRITDINYGNHLANDAVLSIIHEARMQALALHEMTEMNTGGHSLIMADAMVAYRNEAYYGDVLHIKIFGTNLTHKTFDLLYRISTQRDAQTIDIAHVKTAMVCFDYQEKKVVTCGEKIKKWVLGL